jgi:hypothetical protein
LSSAAFFASLAAWSAAFLVAMLERLSLLDILDNGEADTERSHDQRQAYQAEMAHRPRRKQFGRVTFANAGNPVDSLECQIELGLPAASGLEQVVIAADFDRRHPLNLPLTCPKQNNGTTNDAVKPAFTAQYADFNAETNGLPFRSRPGNAADRQRRGARPQRGNATAAFDRAAA